MIKYYPILPTSVIEKFKYDRILVIPEQLEKIDMYSLLNYREVIVDNGVYENNAIDIENIFRKNFKLMEKVADIHPNCHLILPDVPNDIIKTQELLDKFISPNYRYWANIQATNTEEVEKVISSYTLYPNVSKIVMPSTLIGEGKTVSNESNINYLLTNHKDLDIHLFGFELWYLTNDLIKKYIKSFDSTYPFKMRELDKMEKLCEEDFSRPKDYFERRIENPESVIELFKTKLLAKGLEVK